MKFVKMMYAAAALFLLAGVTACDTASSLASKVDGAWSGAPIRFDRKTAVDGEFTPTFEFARPDGGTKGDVTLAAAVEVTMPVNAPIDSVGTTAVSATATALATVRGTWMADDGDELKLYFDPATLTVTMDPDVQFEIADVWTSSDVPEASRLPAPVMKAFQRQIRDGMMRAVTRLDEIDDIKFHENLMTCEYLDGNRTLSRVQ